MEDKDKTVVIIVNGAPHQWSEEKITYAQVVTLDVPDYPQHPEITYSVKYTKGKGREPEGVLAPGGSVEVKDGMVFTVTETGQS
jgi:Multiubiquitin